METIYIIIGLVAFYSWIHSVVIISRKIENITENEKIVLWVGFITFALYLFGSLN